MNNKIKDLENYDKFIRDYNERLLDKFETDLKNHILDGIKTSEIKHYKDVETNLIGKAVEMSKCKKPIRRKLT